MFKWVSDNPLLALASAVSGAVGGVNSFTTLLGILPAFFVDLISTALLVATVGFWFFESSPDTPAPQGPLIDPSGRALSVNRAAREVDKKSLMFVVLVFGGLAIWNAIPPVSHLFNPTWIVCGTISPNTANACYRFSDIRKRPIGEDCVRPLDDSGYFRISQRRWWEYRPRWMSIERDGKPGTPFSIDESFFDPFCAALRKIP